MSQKRSLLTELGIKEKEEACETAFTLDIAKIKELVKHSIDSADSERKDYHMKLKKKVIFIAAAATLALGATVFAASGIITNWFSSSSSIPEYQSLPTEEQVVKDVGYKPVLPEAFENGYTFKDGSVIDNNLTDEEYHSVEQFKSVTFRYEKDGDTVYFSQDKFNSEIDSKGEVIQTVEGVQVYYHSYQNKIVPPDYQMTEEDKRAEERGDLVFSWGADKVDTVKVQSVSWFENGVHYMLMQMDGELTAEELASMAAEAIAS